MVELKLLFFFGVSPAQLPLKHLQHAKVITRVIYLLLTAGVTAANPIRRCLVCPPPSDESVAITALDSRVCCGVSWTCPSASAPPSIALGALWRADENGGGGSE